MLLTPGAIAPNLNGRSVRFAAALDGPFATPVVDYKLQAAALGFGATVVEGLYADGRARVDADRILIPVTARAARVSGLNAAAGGLLTNVAINGDIAVNGGTEILSDNLRIRSDRIDATAIVVANLATGRYAGGLKGRVNDYRVESVGILNLTRFEAPQPEKWFHAQRRLVDPAVAFIACAAAIARCQGQGGEEQAPQMSAARKTGSRGELACHASTSPVPAGRTRRPCHSPHPPQRWMSAA